MVPTYKYNLTKLSCFFFTSKETSKTVTLTHRTKAYSIRFNMIHNSYFCYEDLNDIAPDNLDFSAKIKIQTIDNRGAVLKRENNNYFFK